MVQKQSRHPSAPTAMLRTSEEGCSITSDKLCGELDGVQVLSGQALRHMNLGEGVRDAAVVAVVGNWMMLARKQHQLQW